ncbi:dihydroneopterin aldolase [Nitratifractor sp.]|uniref:dihydroneopterin aldolase n=1 Tax=Nitratifractor sp. TaxID=2268144 RepID=UPI0025E7DE0B|nr:dihydroneopterin aldolase [Nitratifractor sp.]
MKIEIHSLEIDAVIGILPTERQTPQKILVDLEAEYRYDGEHYLDYAAVVQEIRRTLVREQFGLLEEGLAFLKRQIITEHPEISSLFIRLSKPDILQECTVAVSERWKR